MNIDIVAREDSRRKESPWDDHVAAGVEYEQRAQFK